MGYILSLKTLTDNEQMIREILIWITQKANWNVSAEYGLLAIFMHLAFKSDKKIYIYI